MTRSPERAPRPGRIRLGDLGEQRGLELLVAHRPADRIALGGIATEFTQLLELLLREPGRVITRERALGEIWEDAAEANVVDRYVTRLRRKLGSPPLIRTVRGSGFTLRA